MSWDLQQVYCDQDPAAKGVLLQGLSKCTVEAGEPSMVHVLDVLHAHVAALRSPPGIVATVPQIKLSALNFTKSFVQPVSDGTLGVADVTNHFA